LERYYVEGQAPIPLVGRDDTEITLLKGINAVVRYLKEKGIKTLIITAGPIQVAEVIAKKFGFNRVHGSRYGIQNNKFNRRVAGSPGRCR
jgi:phosphoserine phosphatase